MVYQQEQTDADKNNPDNEKLKGNGEIVLRALASNRLEGGLSLLGRPR